MGGGVPKHRRRARRDRRHDAEQHDRVPAGLVRPRLAGRHRGACQRRLSWRPARPRPESHPRPHHGMPRTVPAPAAAGGGPARTPPAGRRAGCGGRARAPVALLERRRTAGRGGARGRSRTARAVADRRDPVHVRHDRAVQGRAPAVGPDRGIGQGRLPDRRSHGRRGDLQPRSDLPHRLQVLPDAGVAARCPPPDASVDLGDEDGGRLREARGDDGHAAQGVGPGTGYAGRHLLCPAQRAGADDAPDLHPGPATPRLAHLQHFQHDGAT